METDAIVLDCNDLGETDMIVTLFCNQEGKITGVAKGAKKSLRRFVNKLELFTFLHLHCTRKSSNTMAFLDDADLHTSFLNIRQHLKTYTAASVIREFLLVGTREGEPDERIFQLSLWALHNLNLLKPPQAILALFLIRFFDHIGYRPDLERCGRCSEGILSTRRYSFEPGGRLLCSGCSTTVSSGAALAPGTIKILRTAQDLPLERLHRLKISGILLQEALGALHLYGRHLLQRDIMSWKIMQTYGNGAVI